MARIRTIKPEFWQNEHLARLCPESRLLAIALLNHADDHGYFVATHQIVRAACFPFDEDSSNVRRGLDELSNIGWIKVRKAPDGRLLGKVVNFKVHQRVDRPQPSKIADIFKQIQGFDECSSNVRRTLDDCSAQEQGTGNREGNRETEKEIINDLSAANAADPPPSAGQSKPEQPPAQPEGKAPRRKKANDPNRYTPEEVLECWTYYFSQNPKLTPERRRKIQVRLNDDWWHDNFADACATAYKLPFCQGDNDRGWKANIDWFLKPDTLPKILEGFYERSKKDPYKNFQKITASAAQ